jgi:KDO2-lipid IV(A) lauroyltransferase
MNFLASTLTKTFGLFFLLMPKSWRVAWAKGLGWVWFDFLRIRRFTILKNLTIAFPALSKAEKYRIARQSMFHLCYNFVEICLLPFLTKSSAAHISKIHGLDHFQKAIEQNAGMLLLSQHVGNGDFASAVLSLHGIPITIISKKFTLKLANQMWFGIREKMGIRFIEPHGASTVYDILRCKKENRPVGFVLDQFMSVPYGIETKFFGRSTGTAYGLALFAIKTKSPVVPIYTYRDEHLNTHICFERPLPLIENQDRTEQIKLLTQSYNDHIESIIKKYPEQWMWVHRRWKVFG